jgi:hypothetical protein
MAAIGSYIQLRGIQGGKEWDVKPDNIRPLTAREELSARLSVQSAASR